MAQTKPLCDLAVTTLEQFDELRTKGHVLAFLHFDDITWGSTANRLFKGGVLDYCRRKEITVVSVDVDSVPEIRQRYDFLSNPQAYAFGGHGVKLGTHTEIVCAGDLIASLIDWYGK